MGYYDTSTWVSPSPCLSPAPPPNVGIGELAIGNTYPTMSGDVVTIYAEVDWEGERYYVGKVTTPAGSFDHYFSLNGRDWTDNPNNPFAIDWPALEVASGWGTT